MEEELANVILGEATEKDKFVIRHWGIKLKLCIKPLSPKKIIKINRFLCRIKEIKDENQSMFHAMLENSSDLKLTCRAIAISTNFPFKRFVYSAIMKSPLEAIDIMMKILIKQSNATFFLSIMASAKNMNYLAKKTKEE